MTITANPDMRAALDKFFEKRAEIEGFIRAERQSETSRLRRPRHTAPEPNRSAPRTRPKSGAPRQWTYRKIDDSTIAATDLAPEENEELLIERFEESFEALPLLNADVQRLKDLKADEAARVEAAKADVDKRAVRGARTIVVTREGHSRTVKKFQTRAERLTSIGIMRHDQLVALDTFAEFVGDALGVAVLDGHGSTAKQISQYDGGSVPAFASRTPSDRQLIGNRMLAGMSRRVPQDMKDAWAELVAETVGYRSKRARTLAELGETMFGYKSQKQASAAAAATLCNLASMTAHFLLSQERRNCEEIAQEYVFRENILQAA